MQQTRAAFFIMHPGETRQHVAFYPSMFARFGEVLSNFARAVSSRLESGGGTASPPAAPEPTGAPWPWQASDVAAPFSVVNLANGNLFTSVPIVSWKGVSFSLFHNSIEDTGIPTLGSGWSHSYSAHLEFPTADDVVLVMDDGREVPFVGANNPPTTVNNLVYRMKIDKEYYWRVTDAVQNTMIFGKGSGVLQSVSDASGNTVQVAHDGNGKVTTVTDQIGRTLVFNYDTDMLQMVQAPSYWNEAFNGTATELERKFDFGYTNGVLDKIYSPRRDINDDPLFNISLTYTNGDLTKISDYEGNETPITYYSATGTVRRIAHPAVWDFVAGQNKVTYRSYQYLANNDTKVIDERAGQTTYDFDASHRLLGINDQLGRDVLTATWSDLNRPTTLTNVLGGTTTIVYDAIGNPTSITTPRGITTTSFSATNLLLSVTDPVNQTTTYSYDDSQNPTRPTKVDGPGAEDTATFAWGAVITAHTGMPVNATGPNRSSQAWQYPGDEGFQMTPERDFGIDGPIDGGGDGGEGPTGDCPTIERDRLSNSTGEPRVVGQLVAGCPVKIPPGCDGSKSMGKCAVCGCATNYNESGSPTRKWDTGSGGGAPCVCHDDNNCTEPGGGGGASNPSGSNFCGGAVEPYQYDGNEQLVCVDDQFSQGADLRYGFTYDARQRMDFMQVVGNETSLTFAHFLTPSYLNHVYLFPSYDLTYEFSDAQGKSRYTYHRDNAWNAQHGTPDKSRVDFVTTYETDWAGRITSVNRDGERTTYAYTDSTVSPAIVETRPDRSTTGYWLDSDGMVREIKHTDASLGHAVVARFVQTRDAKGRITRVDETILDAAAPGGYRHDTVSFVYGDGNLDPGDLDVDVTGPDIPNLDKLHYGFLDEFANGLALADSDPNRLVREHRQNRDSGYFGTPVEYVKEYWYDPGGNRLAMRLSDPQPSGPDVVVSVTRYNYYYDGLTGSGVPITMPGTPVETGTAKLDYAGHGNNKLYSTQTYYPADPDRVDVVKYTWPEGDYAKGNLSSKTETSWQRFSTGGDDWFKAYEAATSYDYNHDQLEFIQHSWTDYCPSGSCDPCDATCQTTTTGGWDEAYLYDMWGRRILKINCAASVNDPFQDCKGDTTMYDYDGLSLNVIAERKSPTMFVTEPMFEWLDLGDRFVSTYTYGPLGLITRTEEMDNWDTADNRDHYYLPDAYGGNVAMAVDHDGDPQTGRVAKFTISDTFGNPMSAAIPETGMYAWRGQQASATDGSPGLVLMYLRHYDPTIGRFIQADILPVASMTSQGMNRFIYVENDPVNFTDPLGLFALAALLAFAIGFALGAILAATDVLSFNDLKEFLYALAALGTSCLLYSGAALKNINSKANLLQILAAIGVLAQGQIGVLASAPGVGSALALAGILGAAFGAGFALGVWTLSDARIPDSELEVEQAKDKVWYRGNFDQTRDGPRPLLQCWQGRTIACCPVRQTVNDGAEGKYL